MSWWGAASLGCHHPFAGLIPGMTPEETWSPMTTTIDAAAELKLRTELHQG